MIKVEMMKREIASSESIKTEEYCLYVHAKKETYSTHDLSLDDIKELAEALLNYAEKEQKGGDRG